MRGLVDVKTRREEAIANQVLDAIARIEGERSAWEKKIDRLYQMRYGIRAAKTFPFPGASNLHFGLIDRTIRKLKANFVRLVWGITPIASIQARDVWLGRRLEHFIDWLVRIRMGAMRPLGQMIDNMLGYGRGIMKCVWRHETDVATDVRESKDVFAEGEVARLDDFQLKARLALAFGLDPKEDLEAIEGLVEMARKDAELQVTHEVTMHEEPQWVSIDPRAIYVPADTSLIEDAEFIGHYVAIPLATFQRRMKKKVYRRSADLSKWLTSALEEKPSEPIFKPWSDREDMREDINPKRSSTVELYECHFRHDINRDGVGERVVMTIHRPTKTVLRFFEYPYEHGDWPFLEFPFETTQDRWYAPRGIAELLESIQQEINVQHNAKIDAMTMANAPVMFYSPASGLRPEDIRWIPGDAYPVRDPSRDVLFPIIPPRDQSYEREEMILKSWAEDMTGMVDIAMSRPDSLTEPRTAAEIDALQGQSSAVFGSDAMFFQDGMRKLLAQTLALWRQFGPEETEIRVLGQELPIRVTREELAGQYDLVPTGTPANVSVGARLSKALQFLQIAGGIQAPNVDYPGLIRWIAQLLDYPMAERIVTPESLPATQAQAERQMQEIVFMMTIEGYKAPVMETDDHATHGKVIETFLKTNMQKLQGTPVGDAILEHGLIHNQMAEKRTGKGAGRAQPAPNQMPQGQPQMGGGR